MSVLARLYTVQKLPAGRLSIMPHPRGGDYLAAEMRELYLEGVDILVSALTPGEVSELALQNEAQVCQEQGMTYRSYPIPDHSVPPWSPETMALFEDLKTALERGKHVTVHCWMGLGRSALVAASVLVLSGFTPEKACKLLSATRGYHVPETVEQRDWVRALPRRYQAYLDGQQDNAP